MESFLSQRLAELKIEEKSNTTPIYAISNTDDGKIVQQFNSSEAVQRLLSHIQALLHVIDSEKFKQFIEITHSKRYATEYRNIQNWLKQSLNRSSDSKNGISFFG